MIVLSRMFSRQWILTTMLVIAGAALCVRLGIWQLDRLEQRRVFNQHVLTMRSMEGLDLNIGVPDEIQSMEWRRVIIRGELDFENQAAIRNQYHQGQFGYHLITPLIFDQGAILIDRGWIPAEGNETSRDWRKYDQAGRIEVSGQIRLGQPMPIFGGVSEPELGNGQGRREIWINLDLASLGAQIPYPILPVYIQPQAEGDDLEPPIPKQPVLELTEGPHFGYAIQWFSFAAILLIGYPYYLRKQIGKQ